MGELPVFDYLGRCIMLNEDKRTVHLQSPCVCRLDGYNYESKLVYRGCFMLSTGEKLNIGVCQLAVELGISKPIIRLQ